jgi:hypothetical protein
LRQTVGDVLNEYAEPVHYLKIFIPACAALAKQSLLSAGRDLVGASGVETQQTRLIRSIDNPDFLYHFGSGSAETETGWWWLPPSTGESTSIPLSDRVEKEVVALLQKKSPLEFQALFENLCGQFRGLATPDASWVQVCLESYGEPLSDMPDRWQLKESEKPAARLSDLAEVHKRLEKMGKHLGFDVSDGPEPSKPILWTQKDGQIVYAFYTSVSSFISRFLYAFQEASPDRCLLVLPGSRSNILNIKLKRDPRLMEAYRRGWRVLKFRHLRTLSDEPDLTLPLFELELDRDPPVVEQVVQLSIFDEDEPESAYLR